MSHDRSRALWWNNYRWRPEWALLQYVNESLPLVSNSDTLGSIPPESTAKVGELQLDLPFPND